MRPMMKNDPTMKTFLKLTMSMMTTMTTVLHRDFQNAWSSFPFAPAEVACIQCVLWSSRCCLLHAWVARPSMVSVVTPFFKSGNVILPSQRNSVKFFHIGLRASLFVHALLDIARQCGSGARSFRNCACARNPDNLLLFRVFGILQISHRVGSFGCFSMLNQNCQETYMMN